MKNESLNVSRYATIPPDLSPDASPDQLIDVRVVAGLRQCAVGTVRREVAEGRFPRPFKVSIRATRWRLAIVRAWIAARQVGVPAVEATVWLESQSLGVTGADLMAWVAARQAASHAASQGTTDAEPTALKAGRLARQGRTRPRQKSGLGEPEVR